MNFSRAFPLLFLMLLVLFVLSISIGSVTVPFDEIFTIILGKGASKSSWEHIVVDFRIPRALTAVVVGSGLAVCGLEMQALFRNALAGPFVLGISSGASLGVALAVLAGISFGMSWMGGWFLVMAGLLGSALVFFSIIVVSSRVKDNMTLLIFGLMLGSATGAIVSVLQFFSKAEDIQVYLLWTFGNLGAVTYEKLAVLIPLVFTGLFLGYIFSKSLNVMLLGEQYATSMGINVKGSRLGIIISTCLLAGAITAFCGPIAFIGIAVPHLSRLLINTSNHKVLLPSTALAGGIILLTCDLLAQLPGSDQVLPLNAVTSLVGAPVVIWVILKKGHIKRSLS